MKLLIYCLLIIQTCHKQYKSAAELDTHLSSYDHHHKKVSLVMDCARSVCVHHPFGSGRRSYIDKVFSALAETH